MITMSLIKILIDLSGVPNLGNEEFIFLALCIMCDVLMLKSFRK